jgi:hypothetical protein
MPIGPENHVPDRIRQAQGCLFRYGAKDRDQHDRGDEEERERHDG